MLFWTFCAYCTALYVCSNKFLLYHFRSLHASFLQLSVKHTDISIFSPILLNRKFQNNVHTDKKLNKIFLICREIQSGAVAKSYMRKGFLIYEEMRKYFRIYEEAVSHIWLCSTLNFPIYDENFILFFISSRYSKNTTILCWQCISSYWICEEKYHKMY